MRKKLLTIAALLWVAMVVLPTSAGAQDKKVAAPPPKATKRWWLQQEFAPIVGTALTPLPGHEKWLLSEARIPFNCSDIRGLLIAMDTVRFALGKGDTLIVKFGEKIPGYSYKYQSGNQKVFLVLAGLAGQVPCGRRKQAAMVDTAAAVRADSLYRLLLALRVDMLRRDSVVKKLAVTLAGSVVPAITINNTVVAIVGDATKRPSQAARVRKPWQWGGGVNLPRQQYFVTVGKRKKDFLSGSGWSMGAGLAPDALGIDVLTTFERDGITRLGGNWYAGINFAAWSGVRFGEVRETVSTASSLTTTVTAGGQTTTTTQVAVADYFRIAPKVWALRPEATVMAKGGYQFKTDGGSIALLPMVGFWIDGGLKFAAGLEVSFGDFRLTVVAGESGRLSLGAASCF